MTGIAEKNGPAVSVVIPCYNRASLIPRAVASVQAQSFQDLEIILVDDGSTDDTRGVASRLHDGDSRVRYIAHERNKGEAAARNTGIKAASGEFIAFLDSDDEWLSGKLTLQIETLRALPKSVGAVSARHLLVDDDGSETIVRDWTEEYPITCLNLLLRGCGLSMGNTLVVRADIFADVGYCDESLPLFVDLDWLCRLTGKYEVRMLPQTVAKYYKAPMRRGDFVFSAMQKFQAKNANLLKSYGLIDRLRIKSRFYNYVSLAFAANGPWRDFIKTRLCHFAFDPVQHPGNYVHFALVLVGLIPVGKRT